MSREKNMRSERSFNDDLLRNPGDLEYARNQFPGLFCVLDHPDLRLACQGSP